MSSDDGFDRFKAIADQLARSLKDTNINEVAERFGVDPDRIRGVTGAVEHWLSDHASAGEPLFRDQTAGPNRPPRAGDRRDAVEMTPAGGPHPLDPPTNSQGTTLSALDSGRWMVRPGSGQLTAAGPGPVPADEALDLVNEIRARDWITVDGAVTLMGRQALLRWSRAAGATD